MTLVTLVGEKCAKEGFEFIYTGPQSDCKNCKLKNACMNLHQGLQYRITKIRDVSHDCKLHDKVCVVEVETSPFEVAVEKRHAEDNMIITVEPRKCDNIGCDNYFLCAPRFFNPGKYRVLNAGEGLKCHRSHDLKVVAVEKT